MSKLIKAYSDELNSVYKQIDALWPKADNHSDKDYYLTDEFHINLKSYF